MIRSESSSATTTWTSITSFARSPGTDVDPVWSSLTRDTVESCSEGIGKFVKVERPTPDANR